MCPGCSGSGRGSVGSVTGGGKPGAAAEAGVSRFRGTPAVCRGFFPPSYGRARWEEISRAARSPCCVSTSQSRRKYLSRRMLRRMTVDPGGATRSTNALAVKAERLTSGSGSESSDVSQPATRIPMRRPTTGGKAGMSTRRESPSITRTTTAEASGCWEFSLAAAGAALNRMSRAIPRNRGMRVHSPFRIISKSI